MLYYYRLEIPPHVLNSTFNYNLSIKYVVTWVKLVLITLALEQEVAHVAAEGTADVATAVGQGARQTSAIEWTEGVGTTETKRKTCKIHNHIDVWMKGLRSAAANSITCINAFA